MRLTYKLIEVLDYTCLEVDRLIVWCLQRNLLTTLHVLVPTRALLWRGKPPTPLVASSYWSLSGFMRLLIDILSWVWQHDQCGSGGRETSIQTKSLLWFSTLKWLYSTHTPWSNYSGSSSSAVGMLNLSEFYLGHVLPVEALHHRFDCLRLTASMNCMSAICAL